MNVTLHEMNPRAARERWLSYCKSLRNAHGESRKEDEALRAMYREMSRGRKVLIGSQVIRAAGLGDDGRPLIGLAPADAQRLYFSRSGFRSGPSFWCFSGERNSSKRNTNNTYRLPELPGLVDSWLESSARGASAAVPHIPVEFRPPSLKDFWIMWEPKWERTPPDPDPFLLKRIGPDAFAVMAIWDMTPLEQAILEGRL